MLEMMEAAIWERGVDPQKWPVLFQKKRRIKHMGSSLVKGNLSCQIQASCFHNHLHE